MFDKTEHRILKTQYVSDCESIIKYTNNGVLFVFLIMDSQSEIY
jgi:hypothetical protein